MKKKFLCTLLACSIVISTFVLCGANFDLSKLDLEAGSSAQIYIGSIPSAPDTLEVTYALQAVNAQLGHDCEDGYVETLYNAEGQAEYLLAVAADGGYAIYHRVTGDLMELGEFGASPYAEQSGTKYYFGPSNYAVKNGTETVDVMRETVMDVSDVQNASSYMSEIRTEVVSKSEIKTYSDMLSVLRDAKEGDVSTASIPTDGTDWESNPYLNEVSISNFINVPDYQLFSETTSNEYFGENASGSCIYVSTVLLLRYADYTKEPGLIPNKKSDIPQMWKDYTNGKTVLSSDNKKVSSGGTEEVFDCTITDNDSAYEALHKFLIALDSPEKFGSTGWDVSNYYNTLPQCFNLSNNFGNVSTTIMRFNIAQTLIAQGNPVAVSIRYYDITNGVADTTTTGHAIVAYGYYQNGNNMYLRAHFGWEDCSSIIVPYYYLSGKINYLDVTNTHGTNIHSCTNQRTITLGGTQYTVDCFAPSVHQVISYTTSHKCACGLNETHSGVGLISEFNSNYQSAIMSNYHDSTKHFILCRDCHNLYSDIYLTEENFSNSISQFLIYSTLNNTYDNSNWDLMTAPHRWQIDETGNSVCIDCGYVSN